MHDALKALASGESPGNDTIPTEVLGCYRIILAEVQHRSLSLSWTERKVPQDMRDTHTVTLTLANSFLTMLTGDMPL